MTAPAATSLSSPAPSTPRLAPGAPHTAPRPVPSDARPGIAPPSRIPAGVLLEWSLARRGLAAAVRVQTDAAAPAAATSPSPIHVHLRRPISAAQLAYAARHFRDHAISCLVLVTDDAGESAYDERLHVDGDATLLRIERRFHRHSAPVAPDHRPRFVGVIHRAAAHPAAATAWASLRQAVLTGTTFQVLPVHAPRHVDVYRDLAARLSPADLAHLAAHLGFTSRGDGLFAPPDVALDPAAVLRGPLLIETPALPGDIHIGPDWIRPASPRVTVAAGAQQPVATSSYFVGPAVRPRPVYTFLKRWFDILFSLFVLAITLPITLAVALIIKFSDFGPVFFVQQREGLHGRPFGCIKFRSMVRNAEALKDQLKAANQVDGPQFKIAHDPRITRIGRFLRKTNIDELPQFLNVIFGQMSVVGPRPSPFKENQLCPPWREARLSVKPGITGLWQVSRSRDRGAADFQEWIYFDTQYTERRTFWLDIKIILLTIKEILGKGQ